MALLKTVRERKNGSNRVSFALLALVLSLVFFSHIGQPLGSETRFYSPQVTQATYDLVLLTSNNNITRGEDLEVSIGITNTTDRDVNYVPDVTIRIGIINETHQVVYTNQYNTTESLLNISISFKYLLIPGNYSLYAETQNFLTALTKNMFFTVYVGSAPKLAFLLPTDPVLVKVGKEYSLNGEILNTGGSSAFNISVNIGLVDNFPLSEISSSLPQSINRLNTNSMFSFSINVTLSDFGQISLSLELRYIDEHNKQFITSYPLSFYSFPQILFSVYAQQRTAIKGNVSSFEVRIQNQENENIHLSVRVVSEDVDIVIQAFLVNLDGKATTTLSIMFIGYETGVAKIVIYIDFIERNGDVIPNAYELAPIYLTIQESLVPTQPTSMSISSLASIRPWLLTIFLSTIGLILIALVLYMFRFYIYEIINSIFNQFKYKSAYSIGERSFEYESDIVVVDGSNVAWDETDQGKARLENILTAIKVLKAKGFKQIIIVIDAALRYQIDDRKGLDKLIKQGIIKPLPARVKADQFIIRLAEEKNAMILSNDLYREYRDDVSWIDERRIPFTILNKELYLHPTLKRSLKLQQKDLLQFKDPSHPVKTRGVKENEKTLDDGTKSVHSLDN